VASDGLFTEGAYGGQRLAKRDQWIKEAARRLRWVQSVMPSGRLLEVGSATGEFVHVAERAGFSVTGLETSQWAAKASRDLTSSVVCADPEEWLPQQNGRYDAVAVFHTLEHVHEPEPFLRSLSKALVPGGRIFLEVPNGRARDLVDGEKWLGARLPDHVLHYRDVDLERLCRSAGVVVERITELSMREFDSTAVWALRRARWLAQGRVAPSQDLLRLVATRP
jgi:2-polyprenyl-3-methyl-5-hydroxy-6-metoxy-1,4-benzoquinol methylase